ncbi:hypothetical protein [Methylomarinum vadi]|uniref:hypothetical protein n=1 Tax=Methylomarinum vadi TaxID=438855 RepID=UPI000691D00A|nr:hypothetical protein [Methylomarinum vadi]
MLRLKAYFSQAIEVIIKTNFAVAIVLIIGVPAMTIFGDYSLFEDNNELYGPLANNLLFMLIYLALAEINIVLYCWYREKQSLMVWVGFFHILTIGGLEFYSNINQIPVDPSYDLFFLYEGVSHILLGFLYMLKSGLLGRHELRF